jgi:F420-dependent oxidoreductase-like protein
MIRLGYQIPVFDYPGVDPGHLFEAVADQAVAAERSGFDTVLAMDHLYQIPLLGPPDANMLECHTLLSALAARTEKIRLSALVASNTYRNPAFLAKVVTSLDIVSSGRAICGIGAGWFEDEHVAFGYEFGTFADRFEKLEEALEIITAMFGDERPTLDGKHYRVSETINQPPPVRSTGIPVMIGGSGEKKTLRLVARYAQESNLTCASDEVPRKLDALAGHCADLGRDRSEIDVSVLRSLIIAPDMAGVEALRDRYFAARGMDWHSFDEATRAELTNRVLMGDPDSVAEQVESDLLGLGIDGLIVNMVTNGNDPEMVELAGETLAPLFT